MFRSPSVILPLPLCFLIPKAPAPDNSPTSNTGTGTPQ